MMAEEEEERERSCSKEPMEMEAGAGADPPSDEDEDDDRRRVWKDQSGLGIQLPKTDKVSRMPMWQSDGLV